MSFLSTFGARVNTAVSRQLGEVVAYVSGGVETSINAILIREPNQFADEFSFEFRPTLDIPAHLHPEPTHGDRVTAEDGSKWLVDSWDEYEGMWRCILRSETEEPGPAFTAAYSTAFNSINYIPVP